MNLLDATLLARNEWIAACQFHPLSEEDVLRTVVKKASQTEQPVVVLDLDSTVYEVAPRTHKIVTEWSHSPFARDFTEAATALKGIQLPQIGYSIRDTFENLGLSETSGHDLAARAVKDFWLDRFFTDEYLQYDRPYSGSAAYARELVQHGIHIVYLTGRDEPGMGKGTRENLARDGFPLGGSRITFMLKPDRQMDDLTHKLESAQRMKELGNVVASFENEPLNVVALAKAIPEAMHVFVNTVCSTRPTEALSGLYRIGSQWGLPSSSA